MSTEEKLERRKQELSIVAEQVGNHYTPEQVGVVQKNVAQGTTISELAYFLNVCKTMELNPFNKEVWCYKDNRGNLLIFAGRDGFLSKAQKHPLFNGIRSSEVCENDIFDMDIAKADVSHKISLKDRGKILGAYCFAFRKDGEPTIEWADFKTYNKGYNAWKTHPAEMIKKVAESHALKKAFGISGIQVEYEYEYKNGVAVPNSIDVGVDKESLEMLYDAFSDRLNPSEAEAISKIIEDNETRSFTKAYKTLKNIERKTL